MFASPKVLSMRMFQYTSFIYPFLLPLFCFLYLFLHIIFIKFRFIYLFDILFTYLQTSFSHCITSQNHLHYTHHLLTYLPTYLSTYLSTYLPTYLSTYLPTYLPTSLPNIKSPHLSSHLSAQSLPHTLPSSRHLPLSPPPASLLKRGRKKITFLPAHSTLTSFGPRELRSLAFRVGYETWTLLEFFQVPVEVGRGMEGVRGGGGVKQGVKIEDKSYSLFYAFSFLGE